MRSMSACASDHTTKPGLKLRRLTGNAERKAENPACISPQTERQWARAIGSAGNRPACGKVSCRYSPIANVSQIVAPSWFSAGTRIDDERSKSSARTDGSAAEANCSVKSRPAHLHKSQPRSDHDE